MKTEKMSFSNIKDVLSRDEMKSIMAGSGGKGCGFCFRSPVGTAACYRPTSGGSCKCGLGGSC